MSNIVLAGDPYQLEPVTQSRYAKKWGFSISFMEYLFAKPCYRQKGNKYNSKFIVQLRKNYRSHPAIVEFPSKIFYGNMLESKADQREFLITVFTRVFICSIFKKKIQVSVQQSNIVNIRFLYYLGSTNWFIDTEILINKKFPIILHPVKGTCKTSAGSSSFYNKPEAKVVLGYVIKILSGVFNGRNIHLKDIGIVSPYRKQCDLIRNMLKENQSGLDFSGIAVGSAEVFQGQEKPVIIVSPVRTAKKTTDGKLECSLGFVSDPRVSNLFNSNHLENPIENHHINSNINSYWFFHIFSA